MDTRHNLRSLKKLQSRLVSIFRGGANWGSEISLPETGFGDDFYKSIPIFINNRDLLEWPKKLVEFLTQAGYNEITIIDNDSTYPPLLRYYEETSVTVHELGRNLGLRALFDCGILDSPKYSNRMYVYTDSDCIPALNCPTDFLRRFHQILINHTEIPKAGFSLCAWNWAHHWWEVEAGYFSNRIGDYAYAAPIDTTFALYRNSVRSYCVGGYRTTHPYLCRHMPWELLRVSLDEQPEDFLYYLLRANRDSSVARLSQDNSDFLNHPRVQQIKRGYAL